MVETDTSNSNNGESIKVGDALMSPYYLHPSDNTSQIQTPILLNGNNYERWAKLMMNSLRTKRKLGFLDGTQKRPSNDSDEAEKWDMVNSMIIGWIYSSIEAKLRPSISLVDSAKVMWAGLRRRFSVSDDTKIHQIHTDITRCKQDGDTVEVYYGRLKVLWDDLVDFETGFKCCCKEVECESMVKYEKIQEKIRVHQFLMGLDNSRFGTARSNLLSRQQDLNLDSAYAQIVQEERHLNSMRQAEERTAVVGHSATASPQVAAARFTKPSTACSHCGKTGHDAANCFQLVGFPDWYNDKTKPPSGHGNGRGRGGETQGRGRGGRGTGFRAYNAQYDGSGETQQPGVPNFTPAQWESLSNLLKSQKQSGSDKYSGKNEKLYFYGTESRFDIIIDSGASHHMTGDIEGIVS